MANNNIQITLDVIPAKTSLCLPKKYAAAIGMVIRPYIPISGEDYDQIIVLAKKADTDFVLCNGIFCTFGTADGGYALMPIAPKYIPAEHQ
jgi:hypothetical protein